MKKKRILSFILALCLTFGTAAALPEGAFETSSSITASAVTSGDYEYEILDDGTIEITGYSGNAQTLSIPKTLDKKTVTGIGSEAFYECDSIKEITIPSSVTYIGSSAFTDCTNLVSVTLPDSITSIGYDAFSGCYCLSSINYPKSLEETGGGIFNGCTDLTSITVPEGVTALPESVFSGSSLKKITLPSTLKEIGSWAFSNCTDLTSLTIADSVTDIGSSAFYGCENLSTINYPKSLKTVGGDIFQGCTSLTSITVPEGVTALPESVFSSSSLKKVTLPSTLKKIEAWAFLNCTDLSSLTIADSVTDIGNGAFNGCESLSSINYPKSLKNTGSEIFQGCTSLTSITVPEGVTALPDYVFDSSSLKKVTLPSTLKKIGSWAFYNCTDLSTINIPDNVTNIGSEAFYGCESLTKVNMPNGVTDIGSSAFYGCENLSSINYPKSLKNTGSEIFQGCTSLTSITVPEGVTALPDYVFDNSSLKKVTLPSTLKKIGSQAFYNCTDLSTINIPDNVTNIGSEAFYGCESLTKLNIPNGVTDIGASAFQNCKKLADITYPLSLKNAGYEIFSGCSSLNSVTVPSGVTQIPSNFFSSSGIKQVTLPSTLKSIGSDAFYDCTELISINIPDSVTSIGGGAFSYCESLLSINYPSSLKSVGSDVFKGCASLTSIKVPEGVTEIPDSMFSESGLKEIILPSTLTTIGSQAFWGCKELASLEIPDSVTDIGYEAFDNCDSLTIYCPEHSLACIYMIDNDIPFVTNVRETDKSRTKVINEETSRYITNYSTITSSGNISLILDYEYKKSSLISDEYLEIRIPSNYDLLEKTLFCNDVLCKDYEYDEDSRILTIPVSASKGRISYSIKPLSASTRITSYALFKYDWRYSSKVDVIGVLNVDMPHITIDAGNVTNKSKIAVSGMAPINSRVNFYINGTFAGQTTANKAGIYKSTIQISNPKEGKIYTIKAEVNSDKNLVATTDVNYSVSNPVLTGFTMTYNGQKYDLTTGLRHSVTFASNYKYNFELKFDNPKNLNKVYVTSTRNNTTKYIEAKWNEKTKSYTTQGYFDKNDLSYVPGELSVEYTKVRNNDYTIKETEQQFNNAVTQTQKKYPNVTSTTKKKSDGSTEYTLNAAAYPALSKLGSDMIKMTVKTVSKSSDTDWYAYGKSIEDFYTYFFDKGNEKYFLNIDYSKKDSWMMIIDDIASNKIINITLETISDKIKNPIAASNFDSVTGFLSLFGDVKKMYDIDEDYDQLVAKIHASGMTGQQKTEALKKAKELRNDRQMFTLLTLIMTTAAAGTGGLPFALLMGSIKTLADYYFDIRMSGILNGNFISKLNWCIDPSGYVYSGKTSNRLANVKATLYYIPYDEKDSTYWKKPQEDKAVIWNASEYSQVNPIYTDKDGNYAWDVPEGWWRVKYELKGYETTYSEWMKVPPPQTNININMKKVEEKWNDPTYSWAKDNSTCTAKRISKDDASHVETETVKVTSTVKTPATCTAKGTTLYTAVFKNKSFATQTKEVTNIAVKGHSYGTPTYTWSKDNTTCTAKRVCKNDASHVETETVKVTSTVKTPATCTTKGTTLYTAVFKNKAFAKQTKEVTNIAAKGHKWGSPTYTWSKDNTTCTAKRVCKNDAKHVETETVKVTSTVKTPATCTTKGTTLYTATFKNKAFAKQTKEVTNIAAKGHSFSEWKTLSYNFKNNTSTQTRTCSVCGKTEKQTTKNAIDRLAGANRYATASTLSETMYKTSDTVILATGLTFNDALVAVPLASAYNAPLLLGTERHITAQTEAELKRLKAKNVIIVSTNGAIGAKAKAELKALKLNTTYIEGKTCFETASKVAKALQSKTKKAPDTIFFATDGAFADALSASPVAAIKNAPIIYLKNTGSIDSATANYLKSVKGKVKNAYVIGGDGVISNAMMKNVATALGLTVNKTVIRVAGKNRYETCVAVNNKFKSILSSDGICVAKGLDFPDALAGGVYAAKNKQALFLADGKKLQDVQNSYLKGKNAAKITVFGGTGAVPDDLVKLIAQASV